MSSELEGKDTRDTAGLEIDYKSRSRTKLLRQQKRGFQLFYSM